ncbi:hypothetical protein [Sphingosinicella sp.]|uniref:hypothetical protein n=1 Tax=Sphingosinicella sp. TaxID=1917971 RepID=UPI002629E1DD|nr:hypothetical protein [Sphingosinicella sp.]
MATVAFKTASGAAALVGEFITEARVEALNAGLVSRGLDASRIISVFEMPAQPVANGHPARYRVLYRQA